MYWVSGKLDVQKEIREASRYLHKEEVTVEDFERNEHFDSCIKEALRLVAPVPF